MGTKGTTNAIAALASPLWGNRWRSHSVDYVTNRRRRADNWCHLYGDKALIAADGGDARAGHEKTSPRRHGRCAGGGFQRCSGAVFTRNQ